MGTVLVSATGRAIDAWLDDHAIRMDPKTYAVAAEDVHRLAVIDAALTNARLVFLGETNHFIHEKTDFRLWWLKRLARHHRLVVGEELGWSDGRDVARYLADGDEMHLDRLATFGDRSHVRTDRDDQPAGVLRASFDAYPTALFKAEQTRFYRELRTMAPVRFFGFDIDAAGAGYADAEAHRGVAGIDGEFWTRLARVPGESWLEEADRLTSLLPRLPATVGELREDLQSMIETLRYTALAHPAPDYDALRPAMAYRETTLKRRVERMIHSLADDEVLVLMAHAFHLAKRDDRIKGVGVGPGGDQVSSLGHHLFANTQLQVYSVWLLYGGGHDSQPFPDLPRAASYPVDSLNGHLARRGSASVVPVAPGADALARDVGIGHMYNLVVPVHVPSQADAIFFVPQVTPLQP
jgi:erythromycin esterase-like protein